MHILLTDVLTCPRCGPDFGLIVLADRSEDRQVREGKLGCANCRLTYPIEHGVADLRLDANDELPLQTGESVGNEQDRGFRAAALLGAPAPNASLLVVEPEGDRAAEVAGIFPESHVIGVSADRPSSGGPTAGILSRVRAGGRLPFRSLTFRGAALLGTPGPDLLREVHRVLAPRVRLVIDRAPPRVVEGLRELGLEVLLDQEGVVVAAGQSRG